MAQGPIFVGIDSDDTLTAIAAGDFNGDGDADLAFGAAFADGAENALPEAGEVYVFLDAAARTGEVSVADADFTMTGGAAGEQAGRSLAAVDLNADRIDDLIIGAPAAEGGTGRVYIVPGNPQFAKVRAPTLTPEQHKVVLGAATRDYLGYTLATGHLDDDDTSDLAIGAFLNDGPDGDREDAGAVYVFFGGRPAELVDLSQEAADAVVYGADAGDHLGESLSAGDFNGDGREDLVAASTFGDGPDNNGDELGETYVLTGEMETMTDLKDGVPGVTVIGADNGDQLGHSSTTLDFNGDGFADLLLGAVSADGADNNADLSGEVALVLGRGSPPDTIFADGGDVAVIYGVTAGRLGRSVASGDFNGDGFGDALLGASEAPGENGETETGAAYLIGGNADAAFPETVADADLAIYGRAATDNLGTQVNGIPALRGFDLNDDGLDDAIVAASRALEKRGEVLIFFAEAGAE